MKVRFTTLEQRNDNYICNLLENEQITLPYTVGALLYSPATNMNILESIIGNKFGNNYSLALCLEDSINDSAVEIAEEQIISTFNKLNKATTSDHCIKLPKIFIRVRNPEQVLSLFNRLGNNSKYLTGFIFPKYSLHCCEKYNNNLLSINKISDKPIYMMPILESSDIVNLNLRYETLYRLKAQIDVMSKYVLNIRVGGNDFCKGFGIRRHYDQTIYEILAVSNILSDIITVFSSDYVVSGPVFEYFSGETEHWKDGLRKELKLDKLNGFIGKTVIHPNQISVVNDSLKVNTKDYMDALNILSWSDTNNLLVSKNSSGERMNEVKTHLKWAEKTIILAKIYGVF